MNILKEMELFVRVVHCDGLAAAGRELGITPSSVTMRINNLEAHYQVQLLTRTTRKISLTDRGREFYLDSLKVLEEVNQVESKLTSLQNIVKGPIRIAVTSDLGRQHIAPLVNDFKNAHPGVEPFLSLNDSITDLADNNIDVAIRYGKSANNQLITERLTKSRRVLCASPDYLKRAGLLKTYTDLKDHACLTMVHSKTPRARWYFTTPQGEKSLMIQPSQSCNDGALIRQWALDGAGIALKSFWDIANDLKANRLVTVLDQYKPDYQSSKLAIGTDLFIVYPNRENIPNPTREFIRLLKTYFDDFTLAMEDINVQ